MIGCRVNDQHFPYHGHTCPRFDLDYTIEDGEFHDLPNRDAEIDGC